MGDNNAILQAIANLNKDLSKKMDEGFKETQNSNRKLEDIAQKQEKKIENLERTIKRKNIVIYNFDEEEEEDLCSRFVKFVSEKLEVNLQEIEIDFIRRIGKKVDDKHRPVIVGLTTQRKKDMIFRNKKKLKETKIYISDDLTESQRQKRSELHEKVVELKNGGLKNVRLKFNKILVNGKPYITTAEEEEKRKRNRSPELKNSEPSTSKPNTEKPKRQKISGTKNKNISEASNRVLGRRWKSKDSVNSNSSTETTTKTN